MDESWPRRAMLAVRPGSSHRCWPASARLEIVPPLPARAKAAVAVTTVAGAAAAVAHWELQLEVRRCPWQPGRAGELQPAVLHPVAVPRRHQQQHH